MSRKVDLPDLSHVVYHGDFFSLYVDFDRRYWVVSNDFSSTFYGPFSSCSHSWDFFCDVNQRMRWIKKKGVDFFE